MISTIGWGVRLVRLHCDHHQALRSSSQKYPTDVRSRTIPAQPGSEGRERALNSSARATGSQTFTRLIRRTLTLGMCSM